MQRSNKEITARPEIDNIIRACRVCHLALARADEPYAVPLSFGYDGRALYFHTAKQGRKLDFIAANPRAGFHFACDVELVTDPTDSCNWTFAFASVVGRGIIRELTGEPDKILGLNQIMLHYSGRVWDFNPAVLAATRIWRLEVEEISGKRSAKGDSAAGAGDADRGLVLAYRDEFVVRDFRREDAAAIARYANNPKIAKQLRDGFPHPYSLADAEAFLDLVLGQNPRRVWAIAAADEAIGSIGLMPGRDVHRLTAEMGYWLAEPFWGRGLMSWAVKAVADHGFIAFGLKRIHADPYANNLASARVLQKAGFALEGIMRAGAVKHGEVLDQFLYAKTC